MKNKDKILKELDNFEYKMTIYRGWDSVEDVDKFIKKQIKKIRELIKKIDNEKL